MNTGQRNIRSTSRSTSRSSMLLDKKSGHSKICTNIDSTTLARYIEAVKNAPSINEEKAVSIKKLIQEGKYMSDRLLEKIAENLSNKIK